MANMANIKKIRLLQITHDLQIGGLQQVVVNLCRTIDREKFEVTVLCLRTTGELLPEIEKLGIEVVCLPRKEGVADYFSFTKVIKVIKEKNIDVIHTHNTHPFFDGSLAAIFSGLKVVIHTDHARHFPDKRRYMFAEWLLSHYAYKVVGVSEHTADNLMRYEKISRKKISVITNGVDESVYDIEMNVANKKSQLGLASDSFVVGVGVRLAEQKGVSHLIKAMTSIVDRCPNTVLVVAGDGEDRNTLENMTNDLGLQDNVMFLGARTDMPELLKIFDVYALPSFWEGLPMALLEAMASGCPIVATDVGGVSMAVKNEVNGLLVEPREPKQLADSIIELLLDDEKKSRFIVKGKEMFFEKFSARRMSREYEQLYLAGMGQS